MLKSVHDGSPPKQTAWQIQTELRQRLVMNLGLDQHVAEVLTLDDLHEIERFQEVPKAGEKVRLRVPVESPPQPAGVHSDPATSCSYEHTVKECSRQVVSENRPGWPARPAGFEPATFGFEVRSSSARQCLDSSPESPVQSSRRT